MEVIGLSRAAETICVTDAGLATHPPASDTVSAKSQASRRTSIGIRSVRRFLTKELPPLNEKGPNWYIEGPDFADFNIGIDALFIMLDRGIFQTSVREEWQRERRLDHSRPVDTHFQCCAWALANRHTRNTAIWMPVMVAIFFPLVSNHVTIRSRAPLGGIVYHGKRRSRTVSWCQCVLAGPFLSVRRSFLRGSELRPC